MKPKRQTEWRSETGVYLRYCWALLRPGHRVPVFDAHNKEPGSIETWEEEEKKLLIDEGRRQLDRQMADLSQIQTRAQIVLTTGLLVVAGLGAALPSVVRASGGQGVLAFLFWVVAGIAVLLAILGSAAVIIVRAEMGGIDATLLSRVESSVLDSLTSAYARSVRTGGNTISTRLSVLRVSVLVLLGGTLALGTAWWLAVVA